MLGLYVHIPFCSAICNYCNFNRGLFDAALKARYVDALVLGDREGRRRRAGQAGGTVASGGPAASPPTRSISAAARPRCSNRTKSAASSPPAGRPSTSPRDAEITLEANPESVDEARLAGFRAAGVNRLSFGVQSFREPELRRLSRLHTADRARAAVGEARAAGFDNISLDLMMWLPEQQVAEWLESVDAAIALAPDHLSLYLLEVYPNAPLKDDMARARWSQAPDDDAAAMYLTAMERLDARGYEQYEISNVARPGTPFASQPQVLERRRVAWLRLRRAFDPPRRPLEECRVHRRVRRRLEHVRVAGYRSPTCCRRRAARRRAVHRAAADGRRKS